MDASMCMQCLSAFCPWLKYHNFFSCTFSVVFLKKKKKLQILSICFLLDILLWSLAYLKIVIRDKENYCHCHLSRQAWRGVAGIRPWPVCMLPQNPEAPPSLPGLVLFSCQSPLTLLLPVLPVLNFTPKWLSCLTFCSTCSNCGASWIVLLTLKALRYLSLHYHRNLHTVSEPARWDGSSEWCLYFRFYVIFFFFLSVAADR